MKSEIPDTERRLLRFLGSAFSGDPALKSKGELVLEQAFKAGRRCGDLESKQEAIIRATKIRFGSIPEGLDVLVGDISVHSDAEMLQDFAYFEAASARDVLLRVGKILQKEIDDLKNS